MAARTLPVVGLRPFPALLSRLPPSFPPMIRTLMKRNISRGLGGSTLYQSAMLARRFWGSKAESGAFFEQMDSQYSKHKCASNVTVGSPASSEASLGYSKRRREGQPDARTHR